MNARIFMLVILACSALTVPAQSQTRTFENRAGQNLQAPAAEPRRSPESSIQPDPLIALQRDVADLKKSVEQLRTQVSALDAKRQENFSFLSQRLSELGHLESSILNKITLESPGWKK
jgi:peptidoglycan hydrolase CwlO-like protein